MDHLTLHRKARLQALIDAPPFNGSQIDFAKAIGKSKGRVTQMLDKDEPLGEVAASSICKALGKPTRYFEHGFHESDQKTILESTNVEPTNNLKTSKGVPVVGEVKGGADGFIDELQYPTGYGDGFVDHPTSDANAYALRVRGDSMHPRYRAGEYIVIEPSIEPQTGDDVVVSLTDGRKMLKELNWLRDGEVQLLSVNNHYGPLTIQASEVLYIHLVAGRARRSAFNKG